MPATAITRKIGKTMRFIAMVGSVITAVKLLKGAVESHRTLYETKSNEKKLDADIEETMDASDSIARY